MDSLNTAVSLIIGVGTISTFSYKYMTKKIQKEKLDKLRDSFYTTVSNLSSDKMSEKIASAILLRRFMDENTEFGVGNAPFKQETINVIAGLLRYETTSDFQKILGDGLLYAKKLNKSDLQRTNLQSVFLGQENPNIDLSGVDFFGADLSGASLRFTKCEGTVFFKARLCNTVLKAANCTNANFDNTDLDGLKFDDKTKFTNASFKNAINIPDKIKQHLNAESIYNNSKENVKTACEDVKKIFVCSQGCMSIKQKVIYDYVLSQLKSCEQKIIVEILSRDKYQYFGITTELKRNIQTSDGVIVFGFSDIFIQEGVFRAETNEEKKIEAADYMSPWIHTEIGIAIGSSKPIFLIHEEAIQDGVSEDTINEFNITKIYTNTIETNFDIHLNKWLQSIEKK